MSPSESRNRQIIESAEALLVERAHGEGHNFMLSRDEAVVVGEAVASRDHKTLRSILSGAIEQLEDHYDSFMIGDLKSDWESEIQRATGLEGNLLDLITDEDKRCALDDV